MAIRDLGRNSWREELDSFSRQHEGWIVSIITRSSKGDIAVAAHDVPLQGVGPAAPRSNDIAIIVGGGQGHLTHEIREVAALQIDLTPNGAERALLVHGHDGTTITIEFRSPMRPEEVDGLPARDHQ
jgi:Family of unknown function (DUF5335)